MTRSRNWVGWSPDSVVLDVDIPDQVSPSASQVSGNGVVAIEASVDDVVKLKSYSQLGTPKASDKDIFFLHVYDRCAVAPGNFLCEETQDSSNILKPPIIRRMTPDPSVLTLNGYIATYKIIRKGIATVDILTMYQGGLYAEYFNNAFLDGVPAITRLDHKVDFDWGLGLITNEVADFVSIRWSGKVLAPTSEEYTFIIRADDGVRFYWQGTKVLDRWETCCEDVAITLPMVQDTFYDIRLEFKEY